MSSIPNAKMKHAQVHHDAPAGGDAGTAPENTAEAKAASPAETLTGRVQDLAHEAVAAVKERPRTVAAIGAAVLAGAAALVGGPAIARAVAGGKKPAAKTPAAKRAPAKKPATRKKAG